ncbi:MAG: aldo/keto reductase [Kiritimatiellaeota bacterium]|nr:aldo/keto reductase [Kiritimatiellota bacterium]
MHNRRIPNTNLAVSPLCLGTMTFGTPLNEADAVRLVHYALDCGINFFDTANMYEGYARTVGSSGGVAENILGKALAGRRDMAVIATKLGMKVGPGPEDEGTSPKAIDKHLNLSLQRMNTDFVDIYYLHKPDPNTPLAETLAYLDKIIRQGKIRHYGISNFSADQTAKLLAAADRNNLPRPVIHQPPYSLLKRDIEKDLLPLCQREKLAVVPYQILQGGLLTGKYRRGQNIPENSRKTERADWLPELNNALFNQLEQIEQDARSLGRTMMQHAIKSVLDQPAVVSVVIGAKSIRQMEALVSAME